MALTYLIVDSFSIVFLLILYASMRENAKGLTENRRFCTIVLMTAGVLLGDMMSWQLDGQSGAAAQHLLWLFNISCYVLSGFIARNWLIYVLFKLELRKQPTPLGNVLVSLPCYLLTFVSLLTPWTRWLFYLDAANIYQRGPLFILQTVIPLGYIIVAAVMAGIQAGKERLRQKRRECLYLASFVLFPLLGGVMQITMYGLSLAWPCTALSLMLVYVNLQSQKISLDALTGLNNRGQFDKYLYGCVEKTAEDVPFALFMLDIDNFKKINDIFGHTAGDAALIDAANILRKALGSTNAFIARYGGDEFAVVLHYNDESEAKRALEHIETETRLFNTDARPYSLVFSAGYVLSDSHRFKDYQDMITAADARMYLQKQQHKAVRA